ncbi:hypothetical protein BRADI_1g41173v3 [Brachypodium distachyon]|uniref:Uncharacterized protein n=1 Tax=Brachypodium distachyon TaxID=15368 RepID=A0A2K2DNP4_BRADI|nr:hypothetical protein BRADI_1g41173v3 [Brachypodium distachyon]
MIFTGGWKQLRISFQKVKDPFWSSHKKARHQLPQISQLLITGCTLLSMFTS